MIFKEKHIAHSIQIWIVYDENVIAISNIFHEKHEGNLIQTFSSAILCYNFLNKSRDDCNYNFYFTCNAICCDEKFN